MLDFWTTINRPDILDRQLLSHLSLTQLQDIVGLALGCSLLRADDSCWLLNMVMKPLEQYRSVLVDPRTKLSLVCIFLGVRLCDCDAIVQV